MPSFQPICVGVILQHKHDVILHPLHVNVIKRCHTTCVRLQNDASLSSTLYCSMKTPYAGFAIWWPKGVIMMLHIIILTHLAWHWTTCGLAKPHLPFDLLQDLNTFASLSIHVHGACTATSIGLCYMYV